MEEKEFDVSIFDQDCAYNNDYAIKASAGTGKTYNIVKIVEKLIGHGVSAKKILIVTYTEKAVGELRNRIRQAVPDYADEISIYTIHSFCMNAIEEFGYSASLPLKLDVVDDSGIKDFTDRYIREESVKNELSQCGISLDRVGKVLKDGVEKYYLNLQGKEDNSVIHLYDQYRDAFGEDVRGLVDNDIDTLTQLEDYIRDHERLENVEWATILQSGLKKIKNDLLGDKKTDQGYKQTLKDIQDNIASSFSSHKVQNRYKSVNNYGQEAIDEIQHFIGLRDRIKDYKDHLNNEKKIEHIINQIAVFYKNWQAEKENRHVQTYNDMIRYVREAVLKNGAFKDFLKEKYQYAIIDEFQDTNQLQFDIFKNVFMEDTNHHLIVVGDEKQSIYSFQGADVDVFNRAVEYINESGRGEIYTLSKNRRSTPKLVEACNAFFVGPDGSPFNSSKPSRYVNYKEDGVEFATEFDNTKTTPIWFGVGNKENEDVDEKQFADTVVKIITECCTVKENGKTRLQIFEKGEIEKARLRDSQNDENVDDHNVSFKDFAVLTRTRSEMPVIEKKLKSAGIPFIRYKDNRLFSGRECAHWIALLEAINLDDLTGDNRKKISKAFFTSFFGVPVEKIDDETKLADNSAEMKLFFQWREMAAECRWEDLVESILSTSKLYSNNSSLSDLQTMSVFNQIGEYCIGLFSEGASLDEVIRKLSAVSGGEADYEKNGSTVAIGTAMDCVKIMTMHSAKGLEFPVVIVAGGWKGRIQKNQVDYYDQWATVSSEEQGGINPNPGKLLVYKELWKGTPAEEFETSEWKRLIYVALTRAKHLLIMPLSSGKRDSPDSAFMKSWSESFRDQHKDLYTDYCYGEVDYQSIRSQVEEIIKRNSQKSLNKSDAGRTGQDKVIGKLIGNKSKNSSYKHSYSSLSHKAYEKVKNDLSDEELVDKEGEMLEGLSQFDQNASQILCDYDPERELIKTPLDYPRGTEYGTAIHEVFEKISFKEYGTEGFEEKVKCIIKDCFKRQHIKTEDDWIKTTEEFVYNVLTAKIPSIQGSGETGENFSLCDLSDDCLKREVEFNFNLFGEKLHQYCNGFVDLIFRRGDSYSILDWKSDRLNDTFLSYADKDSLGQHVDEHYSIQRVLYSYCLIKWLKAFHSELDEEEIFTKHFGGVYYVFIRGCSSGTGNGIYCQTWDSFKSLKEAYDAIMCGRNS